MPKTAQELLQMKEQITQAEKKESELKGQLKEQMSRLKKDFGCSTVEEGEDELDKKKALLEKKNKALEQGVAKLKGKMEEGDGDNSSNFD